MTDADRQLLTEVRDLLKQFISAEKVVDIAREVRMTPDQRKELSRARIVNARQNLRQATTRNSA